MRLPSSTRRQSWVYGLLLTVLCGAMLVAIPFLQTRWLWEEIRSRLHPGQSMPEVLTAVEEALDVQRIPATRCCFMTYFMTAECGDRFWALSRDSGRGGAAEFRILEPQVRSEGHLTTSQAFRFVEANANGCTVDVNAGRVVFTVGDDGKVEAMAPSRR